MSYGDPEHSLQPPQSTMQILGVTARQLEHLDSYLPYFRLPVGRGVRRYDRRYLLAALDYLRLRRLPVTLEHLL